MKQYLELMKEVLDHGELRYDRTGVGTRALFMRTLRFDMRDGFPAVTTKKLFFKSVAAELAGFLEGATSAARMRELGTRIWDDNANDPRWQASKHSTGPDDMGRVYGAQWRRWYSADWECEVDQLREVVERAKTQPHDRRLLVSAWNPGELHRMCLPPCHYAFQLFCHADKGLSLVAHMRSVDTFLGMPFDIASYGLLLHIIARELGRKPVELVMTFADTHIYNNHLEQVRLQLSREPIGLPVLNLDEACTGIDDFKPEHAQLCGYMSHPAISAPMAL